MPDAETRGWTADDMAELGRRHAALESGDANALDALMATLVAEPVYEFYPCRRRLRGGANVRRFYAHFFEHFQSLREGFDFVAEWVSEDAVAQEYDVRLRVDDAVETHRVLGILYRSGRLLGGERIYASDRFLSLLLGDVFEELEPMSDGT